MSWIPSAISGIGALGGLFGGQDDNGASQYRQQQQHYMDAQNQIASRYGGFADQNFDDYNPDNADYRQAFRQDMNYLQQDPYTDKYSTAALNQATAGTTAAYQSALAGLQLGLAQRGLDTPSSSGASSVYAGSLASLLGAKAGTMANAQNQLAYAKSNSYGQRLQERVGMLGSQANQDWSRGMGALGSQSDIYGQMASNYGSMATNAMNDSNAYHSQLMQGLGASGQLFGEAYGDKYKDKTDNSNGRNA